MGNEKGGRGRVWWNEGIRKLIQYGKESYRRLLPIRSELMKEKYRGANHTAKWAVMFQKMREKEEEK